MRHLRYHKHKSTSSFHTKIPPPNVTNAQTNQPSRHPRGTPQTSASPAHRTSPISHLSDLLFRFHGSYRSVVTKMPPFWTIGTLFGASSVMLGAFGAHGLKQRIADPARIANWGTAAQYQVRFFFRFAHLPSRRFSRMATNISNSSYTPPS